MYIYMYSTCNVLPQRFAITNDSTLFPLIEFWRKNTPLAYHCFIFISSFVKFNRHAALFFMTAAIYLESVLPDRFAGSLFPDPRNPNMSTLDPFVGQVAVPHSLFVESNEGLYSRLTHILQLMHSICQCFVCFKEKSISAHFHVWIYDKKHH